MWQKKSKWVSQKPSPDLERQKVNSGHTSIVLVAYPDKNNAIANIDEILVLVQKFQQIYCGWLYFRGYQFSWIWQKSLIRGVQNSWT